MTPPDFLDTLSAERRDAVRAWLATSVDDCAACGRPVLITDCRERSEDGFRHLDCDATITAEE